MGKALWSTSFLPCLQLLIPPKPACYPHIRVSRTGAGMEGEEKEAGAFSPDGYHHDDTARVLSALGKGLKLTLSLMGVFVSS